MFVASCGDPDPGEEAKWQLLGKRRPSSLLAVWASSLQDVWAVGGREGSGLGPSVFHYDGAAWNKLDTGTVNVDLWQVFGFAGDAVFMGGSNGTILRYRNGVVEKLPTPTADIVFGLWGTSADDVFVVGANGLILHYDGVWSSMSSGTGSTLYGIWGTSSFNVYAVGTLGTILHYMENVESPPVIASVQPGQAQRRRRNDVQRRVLPVHPDQLVELGPGQDALSLDRVPASGLRRPPSS